MRRATLNAMQFISFLAGVALFVYVVKQTGVATIADYLRTVGWGFAAIVALSAVRNCARAGSWYFAIDPSKRAIAFLPLMNVMLAGEAIKYLTATGLLLGEPAKAAMVRRKIPLLQGFSSVLIENLIYNLTVFILMLAGVFLLALVTELPGKLQIAGCSLVIVITGGVLLVWLAIRWRWFVLARAIEQLARLSHRREVKSRPRRLDLIAVQVREIETNLYSFYEQRRAAFFLIFSLNIGAHLINIAEVYIILALMKLPATLVTGFLVESATKAINLLFFFVPTRAGVYESGNALLLQTLGMSAAAGVALAIIRKLRAFVWIAYGLLVIGAMTKKGERT
jgi:Lysylphosphatidylglycerol synthase TM region